MRLRHAVVGLGLLCGTSTFALAVEPGAPQHLLTQEVLTADLLEERIQALKPASKDDTQTAAIKKFYAERNFQPIWITEMELGQSAQRVIDEIARADDYGLEADKFDLPDMDAGVTSLKSLIASCAALETQASISPWSSGWTAWTTGPTSSPQMSCSWCGTP